MVLLKTIIWIYSTNYFGLFPVNVEDVITENGVFTSTINFVSKDKYYIRLDGIVTIDNSVYNLNINNGVCCMFELCDNKFFDKYSAVTDV